MRAISGDLGAGEIIRILGLKQHPEGGHYSETFRAATPDGGRAASTMIYYLLQADEVSAWHRVDADEFWLWHAGGPLSLTLSSPDGTAPRAARVKGETRGRKAATRLNSLRHDHKDDSTIPAGA